MPHKALDTAASRQQWTDNVTSHLFLIDNNAIKLRAHEDVCLHLMLFISVGEHQWFSFWSAHTVSGLI